MPAGATGRPDSDLRAQGAAALARDRAGAARVVVHVGGARRGRARARPDAKVAAIERADRELLAPLAAAVRAPAGRSSVCPDHGCDPATGRHDAARCRA